MRLAVVLLLATTAPAFADDKELDKASIVFARGGALIKSSGLGRGETELATLPAKTGSGPESRVIVRALRTDAKGTVLLADLDHKWWWMPLDGSKQLKQLPCGEGPAQLLADGTCVICRSPGPGDKALVISFATGKQVVVDAPALGARVISTGRTHRVVYADKTGVWSVSLADRTKKTKVAPDAPIRSFLPSPDGKYATGVYLESMYDNRTKKPPVETLTTFALDGEGVHRLGIRNGVPLDWSHDGTYVLVQEGAKACLMRAGGGQYKCWKGFTAVSLAPDGSYALVLGARDQKATPKAPAKPPQKKPANDDDPGEADDDVPVGLPTGALALYRAKLDGPYDAAPALVAKIVDGAAVWIPGR